MKKLWILFTAALFVASCGEKKGVDSTVLAKTGNFRIFSASFEDGGTIPARHTCDGENVSPGLYWEKAPRKTVSFALIVNDPDAPSGDFLHWALVNIPLGTVSLPEGARPEAPASEIENDFQKTGYGGPCPPPGPEHRYFFTLYALNADYSGENTGELGEFVEKHALAEARITGLYGRK